MWKKRQFFFASRCIALTYKVCRYLSRMAIMQTFIKLTLRIYHSAINSAPCCSTKYLSSSNTSLDFIIWMKIGLCASAKESYIWRAKIQIKLNALLTYFDLNMLWTSYNGIPPSGKIYFFQKKLISQLRDPLKMWVLVIPI